MPDIIVNGQKQGKEKVVDASHSNRSCLYLTESGKILATMFSYFAEKLFGAKKDGTEYEF
jgi:hypothetical protein